MFRSLLRPLAFSCLTLGLLLDLLGVGSFLLVLSIHYFVELFSSLSSSSMERRGYDVIGRLLYWWWWRCYFVALIGELAERGVLFYDKYVVLRM